MKNRRFEWILAAILLLFCALVWHWQAPANPLRGDEIESYIARLDHSLPLPSADKQDLLNRLRAFGANDDGQPAYMVNLMRYHDRLVAQGGIPASFHGTPAQANAYYEEQIFPMAIASGSFPIFTGNVDDVNVIGGEAGEDRWSRVAVMRYPSRRAFFELLADPRYASVLPYKLGSLHIALVPSRREVVLPDLRLATIGLSIIVFLAAGWARSARRARRISRGA